MSQFGNIHFDRVSEEAHGDALLFPVNEMELLDNTDFNAILNDLKFSDLPTDGIVDYNQFKEAISGDSTEPNEFDGYLGPQYSQTAVLECDNNRALMNTMPRQTHAREKQSHSSVKPIALSESVGVGLPQKHLKPSHKIEVVYPLEESFRPRYKSDYFAQNGKSRKPRYVADRIGNHYVTIRVPVGPRGQIRVDWLTIADDSGHRYSMPYRFQRNNESMDVPDCNPLYLDLRPDKNGTMKLYLVLIKSKQDELKYLQPLKPFQPLKEVFGIPDKIQMERSYRLNPKQLIQKYKLDQSQLAFTYCTLSADGTPIPEWDTTVYSTILTELPPENAKSKAVSCPNCSHKFQVSVNTAGLPDQESVQETVIATSPSGNKRKEHQYNHVQTPKKQNSFSNDYFSFDG